MATYIYESTGAGLIVSGRDMTSTVYVHAAGVVKQLDINSAVFIPVSAGSAVTYDVKIMEGAESTSMLIEQQNVEVDPAFQKTCSVVNNIPRGAAVLLTVSSSDFSASSGYDAFVEVFTNEALTAPATPPSYAQPVVDKSASILVNGLQNGQLYYARVSLKKDNDIFGANTDIITLAPESNPANVVIENVISTPTHLIVKVNRTGIGAINSKFTYVVDVYQNGTLLDTKTLNGIISRMKESIAISGLQENTEYTLVAMLRIDTLYIGESASSGPHQLDPNNILPRVSSATTSISGTSLTANIVYTPSVTPLPYTYVALMSTTGSDNGSIYGGQFISTSSVTYTFGTTEIPYNTYSFVASYSYDGETMTQFPPFISDLIVLSDPNSVGKNVTAVSRDISGSTVTATLSYSAAVVDGDKALVALSTSNTQGGIIGSSMQSITKPVNTAAFTIDGTTYSYDTDYYVASVYTANGSVPSGTVVFSPVFRIADPANAPSLTKLDTPLMTSANRSMTEPGAFQVSFVGVENASSYEVQYATSNSASASWSQTGVTISGTAAAVTGLTGGTMYYFRIKAIGDGVTYSDSDPTAEAGYLSGVAKGIVADPVFTTTPGPGSLALSWPAVTGADSYSARYKLTTEESWTSVTPVVDGNGDGSIALSNLLPGEEYVVEVTTTPSNPNEYVPSIATASDTTLPQKLSAPQNVVLAPGTSPVTFLLTWDAVDNAASYIIQRFSQSVYPAAWVNMFTSTTNSKQFSSITTTAQTFRVIAVPAVGSTAYLNSDPTESNSESPSSSLQPLSTPVVTLAAETADRTLTASWSSIPNSVYYSIDYSFDTANYVSLSSELTGTTYTFTVPETRPAKVRVKAFSAAGSTVYAPSPYGYSNMETPNDSTITIPQLAAPQNLSVVPGTSPLSLDVQWDSVTYAGQYKVEYSTDGSTWLLQAAAVSHPSSAPYTMTLPTSVPVKVRVTALPAPNQVYRASDPTVSEFVAPATPLSDPTDVSVSVASVNNNGTTSQRPSLLTATWSHTGGADVTYRLEMGDGQGIWEYVSGTSNTSFTFPSGSTEPVYVRVKAIAESNSGYTDSEYVESTSGATPVHPVGGPSEQSIIAAIFNSSFANKAAEFKALLTGSADTGIRLDVAGGVGELTVDEWLSMMGQGSLSNPNYKKVVAYDAGTSSSIDVDISAIGVSSSDVTITYLNSDGEYIFKEGASIVGKVVVDSNVTPKYNVYYFINSAYVFAIPPSDGYYSMGGSKRFKYLADGSVIGEVSAVPSAGGDGGGSTISNNITMSSSTKFVTGIALGNPGETASWSIISSTDSNLFELKNTTSTSTDLYFINYPSTRVYTVGVLQSTGADSVTINYTITVSDSSGGSGGGGSVTPPAGNAVCFLADAPVLTPTGYRTISSIAVGDLVRTAAGRDVAVKRVFRKQYEANAAVNPYVIPKGSFGATRALPISPNHEVMTAKGMVAAKDLGLKRMKMTGTFTYYNLELEDWVRDNLVVAGVECESLAPAKRITMTKAEFARFVMARYQPSALTRLRTVCFEEADGKVSMPAL